MASVFLGLDRNDPPDLNPDGITVSASTTSKSLEVVIDLTAGWTTLELSQALDAVTRRLMDGRSNITEKV